MKTCLINAFETHHLWLVGKTHFRMGLATPACNNFNESVSTESRHCLIY
jgi:hypothetical protein